MVALALGCDGVQGGVAGREGRVFFTHAPPGCTVGGQTQSPIAAGLTEVFDVGAARDDLVVESSDRRVFNASVLPSRDGHPRIAVESAGFGHADLTLFDASRTVIDRIELSVARASSLDVEVDESVSMFVSNGRGGGSFQTTTMRVARATVALHANAEQRCFVSVFDATGASLLASTGWDYRVENVAIAKASPCDDVGGAVMTLRGVGPGITTVAVRNVRADVETILTVQVDP